MKIIISGSLSTQLLSSTVTDILLIKTVTHTLQISVIRLNEVIHYIQEWICYIMWAMIYCDDSRSCYNKDYFES